MSNNRKTKGKVNICWGPCSLIVNVLACLSCISNPEYSKGWVGPGKSMQDLIIFAQTNSPRSNISRPPVCLPALLLPMIYGCLFAQAIKRLGIIRINFCPFAPSFYYLLYKSGNHLVATWRARNQSGSHSCACSRFPALVLPL